MPPRWPQRLHPAVQGAPTTPVSAAPVLGSKLDIYTFGKQLLDTKDLDPVYVLLWEAKLEQPLSLQWLLAYLAFYNVGTASWITEQSDYWLGMRTAAGSKEYPRSSERRHYRGQQALDSVAWLEEQGVEALFKPLLVGKTTAEYIISEVKRWKRFGSWASFKMADILDRLGLVQVSFSFSTAMYESPAEGAMLLWELEGKPVVDHVCAWAAGQILVKLGKEPAPPRYERTVNLQEVETILCKWKSYMGGHYQVGKDIHEVREGLLKFSRCKMSQQLLKAGSTGGLW